MRMRLKDFTSVINGCSNSSLKASSVCSLFPCLCKLKALLYSIKASDSYKKHLLHCINKLVRMRKKNTLNTSGTI